MVRYMGRSWSDLRCVVEICVYGHIRLLGRTLSDVLPFFAYHRLWNHLIS